MAAEELGADRVVSRRLVDDDLQGRHLGHADGLLEEPAGCDRVATRREKHIDDLAEPADGAVHVAPPATHIDVGLVDLPSIPDSVPAGASGRRPAAA